MTSDGKGNRILVIRHDAFGDILCTTPFLRQLHERQPGASIDLYSLSGEALTGVPGFGNWIPMLEVPLKRALRRGYSHVYWCSYEHDPTLHILDGYAISTGLRLQERTLDWTVDPAHLAEASLRLKGLKRPIIGFSPTCAHTLRTLSPEKAQEILDLASTELGGSLVVTSDQVLQLTGCLNLSGQTTSIQKLAAIIALCDAWVTVDSAPLHLAQALGIQTVGIFGCTLPELRATRPSHLRIVRNNTLDCLGCYHKMTPFSETKPTCDRGDKACMADMDARSIVDAIKDVLDGRPNLEMPERMEAYGKYLSVRLKHIPEGYAKSVVDTYRARILKLKGRPGFLKRMERMVRRYRKTLIAHWRERG